MTNEHGTVKVWDPLIRIGHWTLVVTFFIAYFTEDDFITQHVWAGYVAGSVVFLRIIWGFIGSHYARFSSFIYSPVHILSYIKNLVALKPQHYIGHNPAGGLMVIALLLCLTGTTLTGLKLYAVEENKGPLAETTQQADKLISAVTMAPVAKAEEDDNNEGQKSIRSKHTVNKQTEEFWEGLHEFFANLTLMLVLLHIGGVIISSIIDKEKLVQAMFTGKKEVDGSYR